MMQPSTTRRFLSRARTVGALLRYFLTGKRVYLAPLLFVVLIAGILLLLTGGLSYVAPFVYAIF